MPSLWSRLSSPTISVVGPLELVARVLRVSACNNPSVSANHLRSGYPRTSRTPPSLSLNPSPIEIPCHYNAVNECDSRDTFPRIIYTGWRVPSQLVVSGAVYLRRSTTKTCHVILMIPLIVSNENIRFPFPLLTSCTELIPLSDTRQQCTISSDLLPDGS